MSVILTILKIIGIALFILLALFLLLACLVLFVPVRYQLQLCMDKDVEAKVTISYLLHFFHLVVGYSENKPSGKLRVLGIPVYDFFPTEEEKKKREEREKKKLERRKQKLHKQKEKQRKKRTKLNHKKNKSMSKSKDLGKNTSETRISMDKIVEEEIYKVEDETYKAEDETHKAEEGNGKKPGVFQKLKESFWKLKLFFQKAVDKVKKLKYTIIGFCNKLKYAKETIFWYVEVLNREESIRAIKKAKHQIGRLFRHIRPKQVRGCFRFGFEDPGTTGDIFSKICMLYPLYANNIVIIPDFENHMFKGELFMKGRIRVATLLHIGWKIMFDKDVRNLYETFTGKQKQ